MKMFKRSLFLLLVLVILDYSIPSANAKDFAIENGKIVLPTTVIRGDYDEVLAKQRFVVSVFLQLVERSPVELVNARFTATDDGFLTGIVPIYSQRSKTPEIQNRVLIFTRDTQEMKIFVKYGVDAFLEKVLQNEEIPAEVWAAPSTDKGIQIPIFIWVKTKSALVST